MDRSEEPLTEEVPQKSRTRTSSAKELEECEVQNEHSEYDDLDEYHAPERTLKIETRIVSYKDPVTSIRKNGELTRCGNCDRAGCRVFCPARTR